MTLREKNFLFYAILLGVAGAALIVMGWMFWTTYQGYAEELDGVENKIAEKKKEILKVKDMEQQMKLYQNLSLPLDPADPDQGKAKGEYRHFLFSLMKECGFESHVVPEPNLGKKEYAKANQPNAKPSKTKKDEEPIYTPLSIPQVQGNVSLLNLGKFLDKFEKAPVLHQIKSMTVEPMDKTESGGGADMLSVKMNVEALIVENSPRKGLLFHTDEPLIHVDLINGLRAGLIFQHNPTPRPNRDYSSIAKKNIFVGLVPPPVKEEVKPTTTVPDEQPPEPGPVIPNGPDPMEFVRLIMITIDDERAEAKMNNRLASKDYRVRTTPGFDYFRVTNEAGDPLLKGQVIQIDHRDVYFISDKKVYRFHIGDTLAHAVRAPLKSDEIKKLGLKVPTS